MELKISLVETGLGLIFTKAILSEVLHPAFICLCMAEQDWNKVVQQSQVDYIATKLTYSSS